MKNTENEQSYKNGELSIWELFGLIFKNWLWFIIFTVIAVAIGAVYSFAFQPQGEVTYNFNELVIYDEWNHYPSAIDTTYAQDLSLYIKEETGQACFSSIALRDTDKNDDKKEYRLQVSYLPSIDKASAQDFTQIIIDWHNTMIDSAFEQTLNNKIQVAEELLNEYTADELAYTASITETSSGIEAPTSESIALEAKRDVSLEMFTNAETELKEMQEDYLKIDFFYVDDFVINTHYVDSKLEYNLVIAFIGGIFISLAFVIIKESYKVYKRSK